MDTFTVCRAPSSVRERRDALGLTRQQIAQLANCSISGVAVIEAGDAPSRSKILTRILAVLDRLESGEIALNDYAPAGNRREVPSSTAAAGPATSAIVES